MLGSGLMLGNSVDAETDGQPDAGALGDDNAGDDENGTILPTLRPGTNAGITINATVPSGLSAFLNGWIDFNADGDWDDPGEHVFVDQNVTHGSNSLTAAVPSVAAAGSTFARLRIGSDPGHSYFGLARDGEVEDYQITVLAAASRSGTSTVANLVDLWSPPLAGPRSWPTSSAPGQAANSPLVTNSPLVSSDIAHLDLAMTEGIANGAELTEAGPAEVTQVIASSAAHGPVGSDGPRAALRATRQGPQDHSVLQQHLVDALDALFEQLTPLMETDSFGAH